jgi:hypothetical protein
MTLKDLTDPHAILGALAPAGFGVYAEMTMPSNANAILGLIGSILGPIAITWIKQRAAVRKAYYARDTRALDARITDLTAELVAARKRIEDLEARTLDPRHCEDPKP